MIQKFSTDQPEAHEIAAEFRELADSYGDRVLIGEIFLPNDRHARWFGTPERPQVHLPINFQLIENRWDERRHRDERVFIALNFGIEHRAITLPAGTSAAAVLSSTHPFRPPDGSLEPNEGQVLLYQRALLLTHGRDSQVADFLIHRSKHEEACDGVSDWCSIGFHFSGFAPVFATM